jgi:glutamate-1-semialdehyde 2,1-aminomutase
VAATLVVPYNQVPQLTPEVAAVIVEPVAANMGLVAPVPGFLEGLRAECDRVGAVLIFDEVITGFRLGRGGAQAKYDISPDLTCFGKVIGGGLPIGAVGGRREIMEILTPLGPVFHAGTLAGNPIATAAGLAAMNLLNGDVYMELMARARHLSALMGEACASEGFAARFPVVGTLIGMYLGTGELLGDDVSASVTDFAQAKTTNERAYASFFHAMLRNGVAMAPGAYEAIFVGMAHTDEILNRIGEVAALAAREAQREMDGSVSGAVGDTT